MHRQRQVLRSLIAHTITLPVTQVDITKGRIIHHIYEPQPTGSSYCPVAFALKQTGRFKRVDVTPTAAYLDGKHYRLDASAQRFIEAFDNHRNVEPVTIQLTNYTRIHREE